MLGFEINFARLAETGKKSRESTRPAPTSSLAMPSGVSAKQNKTQHCKHKSEQVPLSSVNSNRMSFNSRFEFRILSTKLIHGSCPLAAGWFVMFKEAVWDAKSLLEVGLTKPPVAAVAWIVATKKPFKNRKSPRMRLTIMLNNSGIVGECSVMIGVTLLRLLLMFPTILYRRSFPTCACTSSAMKIITILSIVFLVIRPHPITSFCPMKPPAGTLSTTICTHFFRTFFDAWSYRDESAVKITLVLWK